MARASDDRGEVVMDKKEREGSDYDLEGSIGILLIFLGILIIGVYGKFFVHIADNSILFLGLSFFSTFLLVLIRRHRERYPDLPDIYIFICLITRILNYMIVSIAGYSVTHKIAKFMFSNLVGEFGSLEGLNLGILAYSALVPYLIQRVVVEKIFKTKI